MTWRQAENGNRRDARTGRYTDGPICHGCGKAAGHDYGTHSCAGGGDGPGFLLCHRASCAKHYEQLGDAEALAYFTAKLQARGMDPWGQPVKETP